VSVEVGLRVNEVTESAVLTSILTGVEVTVTGTPELSFTCSSKDQVPTVDRVPTEVEGRLPGMQENELPRLL
jgi:hypothetical protein